MGHMGICIIIYPKPYSIYLRGDFEVGLYGLGRLGFGASLGMFGGLLVWGLRRGTYESANGSGFEPSFTGSGSSAQD